MRVDCIIICFLLDMGRFEMLVPDDGSPMSSAKDLSPPEKLARVTSPVEATALQPGMRPVPRPRQANIQVHFVSVLNSYHVEIDHEIFPLVILSLWLIQEG